MHLLLVGISHRTAPVELREQVDFQARGVESALRALGARGSARETVVLSTCNRAELYAACDDVGGGRADLVTFLSEFHDVDSTALAPHLYELADLDVARHLFRVAAGLDSLVVGEPQVLGQVKEAHNAATTGPTRCASGSRRFSCRGRRPTTPPRPRRRRVPCSTACSIRPSASAKGCAPR